jgi:hypothetical protein
MKDETGGKKKRQVSSKLAKTMKVVHNIPDGAYIGGFEKDFVAIFRNEIIKKLFKKPPIKE